MRALSVILPTFNRTLTMATEPRFAFRATATDFAHLDLIATTLRADGHPNANRTDALRHALAVTAHPKARRAANSTKSAAEAR